MSTLHILLVTCSALYYRGCTQPVTVDQMFYNNMLQFMTMCVLCVTDEVHRNGARVRNDLFYKWFHCGTATIRQLLEVLLKEINVRNY
jgi:hypothetical protein